MKRIDIKNWLIVVDVDVVGGWRAIWWRRGGKISVVFILLGSSRESSHTPRMGYIRVRKANLTASVPRKKTRGTRRRLVQEVVRTYVLNRTLLFDDVWPQRNRRLYIFGGLLCYHDIFCRIEYPVQWTEGAELEVISSTESTYRYVCGATRGRERMTSCLFYGIHNKPDGINKLI